MTDQEYLRFWRLLNNNFENNDDVTLIRTLCKLNGRENVLEIGCGTGRITRALMPYCKAITGIDCDGRLIAEARENSGQNPPGHTLMYRRMNAHFLGLPPDSMDIVLLPWVLQEVASSFGVLAESYKVLKPGGTALIIGGVNGDYDDIIGHFVEREKIDSITRYEKPMQLAFANATIELAMKHRFHYVFADIRTAEQAFVFALREWHNTELNANGLRQLRILLRKFWAGGRIRLTSPTYIYLIRKQSSVAWAA